VLSESDFLRSEIDDLRKRAEQARAHARKGAALPPKGDPHRDVWYELSVTANRLENRLREVEASRWTRGVTK
jgi:hypothetical protein